MDWLSGPWRASSFPCATDRALLDEEKISRTCKLRERERSQSCTASWPTTFRKGEVNVAAFIEIEDERHDHVATVHFCEAINIINQSDRKPR